MSFLPSSNNVPLSTSSSLSNNTTTTTTNNFQQNNNNNLVNSNIFTIQSQYSSQLTPPNNLNFAQFNNNNNNNSFSSSSISPASSTTTPSNVTINNILQKFASNPTLINGNYSMNQHRNSITTVPVYQAGGLPNYQINAFSNPNYMPFPPTGGTQQQHPPTHSMMRQIAAQPPKISPQTPQPPPSEQQILDNSFMNLFQTQNSTTVASNSTTTTTAPTNNSRPISELPKPPSYPPPPRPSIATITDMKPPNKAPPPLPRQTASSPLFDINLIDLTDRKERPESPDHLALFDPLFTFKEQQPPPSPASTKASLQHSSSSSSSSKEEPTKAIEKRRLNSNNKVNMKFRSITPTVMEQTSFASSTSSSESNTQSLPRRRSFSYYEKVNDISEFVFVDREYHEDFVDFQDLIDELNVKKHSEMSEKDLTHISVFSPLLERPIFNEMMIKINIRYYTNENPKQRQITLISAINVCIEHILYQALTEFQINELKTANYLFKRHGLEEYLPYEAILCELKYIQECITLGKDPIFILVEVKNMNTQLSMVTKNDKNLNNKIDGKFLFQIKENGNFVSRTKLEVLLKNISQNKQLIKDAINENNVESLKNWCPNFKEKLKTLQILIRNIQFTSINELVDRLDEIEREYKHMQSKSVMRDLHKKLLNLANDAMHACIKFVNCASDSFYWPFKLAFDQFQPNATQKQESIQSEENIVIYLNTLNNIQFFMSNLNSQLKSNSEIYLKLSIYYGNIQLDEVKSKSMRYERITKRTDHLTYSDILVYDKLKLCLLPREAVLVVQLCASIYSSDNVSAERCLAWGSKVFFDDNLTLRSGESFLCLFPGDSILTTTSASNVYSDKAPILYFTLSTHEYIYVFPHISDQSDCQTKDFELLPEGVRKELLRICERSIAIEEMNDYEKHLVKDNANYLSSVPKSLAKIYLSSHSWDYASIVSFYGYLKQVESLSTSEALELLLPHFPDYELRNLAVRSLQFLNSEALSLYLPQLLEALKYERCHNSAIARMLLQSAATNIRFAHKLYWYVKESKSRSGEVLQLRYELLYQGLMHIFSKSMLNEIQKECLLVERIDEIAQKVKKSKDNEFLHAQLSILAEEWPKEQETASTCRLPYNISYSTNGIDIKLCTYIPSFTVPLKLVFKNVDPTARSFYSIYKIGDDLRQDTFVIQLINVMNQLWIENNHQLSVITFNCLQVGDKRGFIEMIKNAETLKEIQKGVATNAFKKSIINEWLREHNPLQPNFIKAVDNFTRSCAAYSVATYVLGIGDRHNDNVMVKHTGHLFHIDFGKYMGDAQMFGFVKRDSAMLFTQDMFYVINQGSDTTHRFHNFVELCSRAFQILRDNYNLILTLIEMMSDSGIPGLNKNAIKFVYKNLMMDQNDDEAAQAFTKIIDESLKRTFSSINFAIHTLAQPRSSNSTNLFNFTSQTYSIHEDGRITTVVIEDDEEDSVPSKTGEELYMCKVIRDDDYKSHYVFRSFEEFCELYQCLNKQFTALKLPNAAIYSKFIKIENKNQKRRLEISSLLKDIFSLQSEIRDSDIIYTFFHSLLRDQNDSTCNSANKLPFEDENIISQAPDIRGQIKLKLKYVDNKFTINTLFARNLKSPNKHPSSLKPYVKTYLRPDAKKLTKKKVHAMVHGSNPVFNETIEYNIGLNELKTRTLEISVLDDKLTKEKIGSVEIKLHDIPWKSGEYIKWYELR